MDFFILKEFKSDLPENVTDCLELDFKAIQRLQAKGYLRNKATLKVFTNKFNKEIERYKK